jgi:hypothetical protein
MIYVCASFCWLLILCSLQVITHVPVVRLDVCAFLESPF